MSVKDPLKFKDYLNLNYVSNVKYILAKALNNHSYDNFTGNEIYNTSQDMFVYRTDE